MQQRRGIENDRNRRELPEQGVVVDAVGQRIHRDIAQRMIDEMADQIAEQHNSTDQPDLAHADAADERPDAIAGKSGHAIHIGDGRI